MPARGFEKSRINGPREEGRSRQERSWKGSRTRLALVWLSWGVHCRVQVSTSRGGTAFEDLLAVGWDHVTEFGQ